MASEAATELNEALTAREHARAAIAEYVEANAEVFLPYLNMIAEHDEITARAGHLAKQLKQEDIKDIRVSSPVKITKTSKTVVDLAGLVRLVGSQVYADYPSLVKSVDIAKLATLHPTVLRDPTLVDEISIGTLRDLAKTGALPSDVLNKVATTTTTCSISGLEPFGSG